MTSVIKKIWQHHFWGSPSRLAASVSYRKRASLPAEACRNISVQCFMSREKLRKSHLHQEFCFFFHTGRVNGSRVLTPDTKTQHKCRKDILLWLKRDEFNENTMKSDEVNIKPLIIDHRWRNFTKIPYILYGIKIKNPCWWYLFITKTPPTTQTPKNCLLPLLIPMEYSPHHVRLWYPRGGWWRWGAAEQRWDVLLESREEDEQEREEEEEEEGGGRKEWGGSGGDSGGQEHRRTARSDFKPHRRSAESLTAKLRLSSSVMRF